MVKVDFPPLLKANESILLCLNDATHHFSSRGSNKPKMFVHDWILPALLVGSCAVNELQDPTHSLISNASYKIVPMNSVDAKVLVDRVSRKFQVSH